MDAQTEKDIDETQLGDLIREAAAGKKHLNEQIPRYNHRLTDEPPIPRYRLKASKSEIYESQRQEANELLRAAEGDSSDPKAPSSILGIILPVCVVGLVAWRGHNRQASVVVGQVHIPCRDEQRLAKEVGNLDIVIPWINGSDPRWLEERKQTCEDFQFRWMWPDAIIHSRSTKECLMEKESLEEFHAARKAKKESCVIENQTEAQCFKDELDPAANMGLTTRDSRCFQRFLRSHCQARLKSVGDHDELRYLLRSIERNLEWHVGRIVLIMPRYQYPTWLLRNVSEFSRLQVIAQEDLLATAMSAPEFVSASERHGSNGKIFDWGYAPDRIFNDFPLEHALAFLPGPQRHMLLLQDDLLIGRSINPCVFFTDSPPAGLRIFAYPVSREENIPDPYQSVFKALQRNSLQLWSQSLGKGRGPYQRSYHAPMLLDKSVMRDIWQRFPVEMSMSLDSPLRHPNMTDIVGLHNAEILARTKEASKRKRQETWNQGVFSNAQGSVFSDGPPALAEDPAVSSRAVTHAHMDKWHKEVIFREGTTKEWTKHMGTKPPDSSQLPPLLSLQDDLRIVGQLPAWTCLRQQWLTELLPDRSSFEDPAFPPDRCPEKAKSSSSESAT